MVKFLRFRILIALAALSLVPLISRPANLEKDRKNATEHLVSEIRRLSLHRIYVQDFLETNGKRTPAGVLYAATFSKRLNKLASDFSVISRVEAHKFLDHSGWTDKDLAASEVFTRFTSEFKPDTILHGTVSLQNGIYSIEFVAQDLSGKELFRLPYQEKPDASFVAWLMLPPTRNPSGRIYYFPEMDGVTSPKMVYAPAPAYTPHARQDRINGVVDLSAVVTTVGRMDQIDVLKKLYPELDAASVATLKTWRLEPAKDPDGNPIPVRIQFQVTFRLY
jgi:TonB family protein